jgi:hypothetical protein
MSDWPHDLEAFLAGAPRQPAAAGFRDRLREETMSLVPKPAAPRRLALLSVACLPIVLLLLWWMLRSRQVGLEGPVAVPVIAAPTPEESPFGPAQPLSPAAALEWQAFDGPRGEQARLYWSAGQAYVETEGDYVSALRCYRQALDAGTVDFGPISDEDDLLAMILKIDRSHQEKKHELP